MRRRLLPLALVLAALAAFFWRGPPRRPGPGAAQPGQAPPPSPSAASPQPPSAPAPAVAEGPADAPSQLADDLNSPRTDIHADLRLLNDLFMHYRSATRELNPVGENAEITAALTGRNRLGFAFVPKGHPAINAKGELCDRWGTPFFFHQISGEEMEIRSAGPDRKLWTDDDEVLTP